MNQLFAGGIAVLLALAIWTSGQKSRKRPFQSKLKKPLSELRGEEITLVQKQEDERVQKQIRTTYQSIILSNPKRTRDKMLLKKKLNKLIIGSPDDRLDAIEIATEWQSLESLPFIRKGLKDSDSRVVIAAAAAITKFKGHKIITNKPKLQTVRPPLNVALMR